jgi:hypothetical protein
MELNIHFQDEVWSKDDLKLGLAARLYHRPEGADPEVKYYDTYLHVEDFELGLHYYVPTDFIAETDDQRRLILSTTRKQVLKNTWDRVPNFVAAGEAEVVELEPIATT